MKKNTIFFITWVSGVLAAWFKGSNIPRLPYDIRKNVKKYILISVMIFKKMTITSIILAGQFWMIG